MFNHVFFSAPHRMMFAGGVVQTLLAVTLWLAILAGRFFGLSLPAWPWPPAWVHAGLMVFGIFPWFFFGFLMTALPKWMGAGPLTPRQYIPPFLLLAGGWLLFFIGLLVPAMGPIGLCAVAAGWFSGILSLIQAMVGSMVSRRHATAVVIALGIGNLAVLAYGVALARLDAQWFRWAVECGLWGCLAPVFFIVLHRMLPFFTGVVVRPYRTYQPMWALSLMLPALAAHGILTAADLGQWRWLPDGLAAGIGWHLSSRWGLRSSLKVPLLAILHLGMLWLDVALTLFALQSVLSLLGISWGGLLPLHSLGIGFFASILLGMSTRVTLGHSGRYIGADQLAWSLFLGLQATLVLRLAGEFVDGVNILAAIGWLAVFGRWASRHFMIFLTPRPDGEPG